jgi:hypothetical protein
MGFEEYIENGKELDDEDYVASDESVEENSA